MPKLDPKVIDGLSKVEKKRLNIWEKRKPIIQVGESFYEVEPQPARSVLEFQELLKLYTDYATQYADLWKEKPAEEEESEEPDRKEKEIGLDDLKGLVETICQSPYFLLKPFIPDLEKEDADAAPWGQVWHNLSVLAEINGLGWGEKLLNEYIVPFVPDLLRSLLALGEGTMKARARLSGESGSPTPISSSTSSPESPTDSTPVEP